MKNLAFHSLDPEKFSPGAILVTCGDQAATPSEVSILCEKLNKLAPELESEEDDESCQP